MSGRETIRQRKVLRKGPKSDTDDSGNAEGEKRVWSVFQLVIVGFIFALLYANYSSPIAAKVIEPSGNAEAIQWASVDNTDLKRGVSILQNLHGPESVAVDNANGNLYTGTHDGRIFQIRDIDAKTPNVIDVTAHLKNGPYTAGRKTDRRRPLGLRLKGRRLYVADAYQGIFAIDLDSNKWEKIVGYNDVTPQIMFADDLVLNNEGTKLYFTDMSEKWSYDEMAYSVVEGDCSGRVLEVDLTTKITRTLRSELCFPNGIELNLEETNVIVSESQRDRLIILDSDNGALLREIPMPGNSDNVRRSKSGGYWVAIPSPTIRFAQLTRNFPFIRNIAARILGPKWLYLLADFNKGMVVKLDDGFIPTSIHKDSDGEVSRVITEVAELEDGFLLCSFLAHGLVKIKQLPAKNINQAK